MLNKEMLLKTEGKKVYELTCDGGGEFMGIPYGGTLTPTEFDGTTIVGLAVDFGDHSFFTIKGTPKSNRVRITNVKTNESTVVTHTSHHSAGFYTATPPGPWKYESSGTHTYFLTLEWV